MLRLSFLIAISFDVVLADSRNISPKATHYTWKPSPPVSKDVHNMTLCRTLRGSEDCEKFLPLRKESGQLPDLYPNNKYSIRLEEPREKRLGNGGMFVPFRCHILRKNEQPNQDNAFIYEGDSIKDSVGILFKQGAPARIEFELQDLLFVDQETPYYWYSGLFHIHCDIIECCSSISPTCPHEDRCPDFRADEFFWQPEVSKLIRAQLKGEFRVLPWTDKTSVFRRVLFQRYRSSMDKLRVKSDEGKLQRNV